MKFEIFHRTHYAYAAPVLESFNEVRLQPASNEHQTVEGFLLRILPPVRLQHYRDFYQNTVHHFEIPEPHDTLAIESRFGVMTHPRPGPGPEARPVPIAQLKESLKTEQVYDFLQESRYVDTSIETWRLAVDAIQGEEDVWHCAVRLMNFVHEHLTYQSNATQVHTHMREVLAQRRGVCQDFAHVMLGLCRTLHLPARYVSGYLATEKASAMHAWTEVFVPDAGLATD